MLRKINFGDLDSNELSDSRYTSTLIMLFGFILLCFIWTTLYSTVQMERQLEEDGAYKEVARLTRAFEEHTFRKIKEVDRILLSLKDHYEKDGQAMDISRYPKMGMIDGQQFVKLAIADENGELIASSLVPFVPANFQEREDFLMHKEEDSGQVYFSKTVFGRSSGIWSIQMSRRINKTGGSFGGIAIVSVDASYFTQFYKLVDLGTNSVTALIGRDGIIRVRDSGSSAVAGQDASKSPFMEHLAVSDTGSYSATSPVDDIRRMYNYQALRDYPFFVLVGVAEEEVFREWNDRVVSYYWVAGASTVIITFFIVMLLGITTRQKQTAQALRQAKAGLEVKVEQRTQELFVANGELIAMNAEQNAMNEELQCSNQKLEQVITDLDLNQMILRASQAELGQKNIELSTALHDIKGVQASLIQQEKLVGIGQLAAGVAHEINNPLGFVTSNVEALEQYFNVFNIIFAQYRQLRSDSTVANNPQILAKLNQIIRLEKEQDLDYISADIPDLFRDTNEGLKRMNKIVQGMQIFTRGDQQKVIEAYNLNKGLEDILQVAHYEIQQSAIVEKRFGQIPEIEAMVGEINQVLLNLVLNAVQAIKGKQIEGLGIITLSTWHDKQFVYCAIEDDGYGIEAEDLKNIFNPFFTTNPVGQGTGMGLSVSYEIIVNRHQGEIMVESGLDKGTKFIIKLPIQHKLPDTIKDSGV